MMQKINRLSNTMEIRKLCGSLLLVEIAFTIHHIFGEYHVYHDGIHIMSVYISIPMLLITFGLIWLAKQKEQSVYKWMAIGIISFVWIGFVGIVEGGGIHILANIFSFFKMADSTILKIFPKLPSGNFINELTGFLEFISAIPLFIHTLRFAKSEG